MYWKPNCTDCIDIYYYWNSQFRHFLDFSGKFPKTLRNLRHASVYLYKNVHKVFLQHKVRNTSPSIFALFQHLLENVNNTFTILYLLTWYTIYIIKLLHMEILYDDASLYGFKFSNRLPQGPSRAPKSHLTQYLQYEKLILKDACTYGVRRLMNSWRCLTVTRTQCVIVYLWARFR